MKIYFILFLSVIAMLLSGCVSTIVTDSGNGSYLSETRASQDWATLGEVQTKNYAAANNFCRLDEKRMEFTSITSLQEINDKDLGVENYSWLAFKCATPSLPF